jgi:hypothetical protein
MTKPLTISPEQARRLAITQQRLAGPPAAPDADALLDIVRAIGCLQLDPIGAVARSHTLALFSRAGPYDLAHLDRLLWRDRSLFEYWAHGASLVLTEDYPIFASLIDRFPWTERTRKWVRQNQTLKRYVLAEIRKRGPLLSRELDDGGVRPRGWVSAGWTSPRNINRMLDYLWISGRIMVVGRDGLQKRWDLIERWFLDWMPRGRLGAREAERRAVLKALQALGVATPAHIRYQFLRGRYRDLRGTLAELEVEGRVQTVQIQDGGEDWPGTWYIAGDAVAALDRLDKDWIPRTTLLSPFDNLICDRPRTELMFDFHYRMEIYVPAAKRKWGYYVLPILSGDRFVGRIDPEMDRERRLLRVRAVYAEADAPGAGEEARKAIESLATFLRAREIAFDRRRVPTPWKKALLA